MIVNIAAPGMKGEVNWSDIQFKKITIVIK